jgi:hypothetical protein
MPWSIPCNEQQAAAALQPLLMQWGLYSSGFSGCDSSNGRGSITSNQPQDPDAVECASASDLPDLYGSL